MSGNVWPLRRGQVYVVGGALADIAGRPEWAELDRPERLGVIVELIAADPDGSVDAARVEAAAAHPKVIALAERMLAGVERQGGPQRWATPRER